MSVIRTDLTPREQQNLRDACMSGLVPCCGSCPGDRTFRQGQRRDFNGADWTLALRGAREWRAERVATLIRRKSPSVAFLAQDYGIVPHTAHQQAGGCCAAWQEINRNAASVLRYRYAHRHQPAVYGLTAWAEAR